MSATTTTATEKDDVESFTTGTTLVESTTNSACHTETAQAGPRTLHVYRNTHVNPDKHYCIKDSDDQTDIYIAEVSPVTRPQIRIFSTAEYNEKGRRSAAITATLHHTNSDVDVTVRNQKFYYVANGWIRKKYEWPSPAFGMNMLHWKRELSWGSKECYAHGDKNVLARWVSAGWSPSKVGEIQILTSAVPTNAGSPALEELLVTLFADREIDSKLNSA